MDDDNLDEIETVLLCSCFTIVDTVSVYIGLGLVENVFVRFVNGTKTVEPVVAFKCI
jgi:hypothetical protein